VERLCNQCRRLGLCQLQSLVDGLNKSGYSSADASPIVKENQGFQSCPKFEEVLIHLDVVANSKSAAGAKQTKDFASNGAGVQYQTDMPVSSRSLNEGTVFGRYYDLDDDGISFHERVPNSPRDYFNDYVPEFLREIVFDMWQSGETEPSPELLEKYGVYTPADINSIPEYVKYAIDTFPHPEEK